MLKILIVTSGGFINYIIGALISILFVFLYNPSMVVTENRNMSVNSTISHQTYFTDVHVGMFHNTY
jgi:hypothetical protein